MSTTSIANLIKSYRPELNGLRALAVLLVLFYHLDFDWMKGGFLGVDIFLVISGYFISKNILHDIQQGNFTLSKFYTKRIRRLFPALLFTIIIVLIAAFLLFTPSYYSRLGYSSLYSALSVSNFFFWNETGYFDLDASAKPLLHMWSLSLEEQFYLVWPLSLVIFYKFLKRYLFALIILGVVISIVLAHWYFDMDRSAVFYLIPFRMFEFLLGAACIWIERSNTIITRRKISGYIFRIGMILMVFSSVYFDGNTRMPGLLSMLPCIGAMLIIISGTNSSISGILSHKYVELIGKASYSIYLIHWPLISLYKYWRLAEPKIIEQLGLGVLSVGIGFFMWYFIENRFRYAPRTYIKVDPVWYAVPSVVLLITIWSFSIQGGSVQPTMEGELYMSQEEILKNRDNYWRETNSNKEILNGSENKGHILVLGNSHAIDIIYALRLNGYEGKITSLQSGGKCFNFGTAEEDIDRKFCNDRKKSNLEHRAWGNVDAVYVHDDWPKLELNSLRKILKEIRQLNDVPVYIFGPKMVYSQYVPEIARNARSLIPQEINDHANRFALKKQRIEINESLISEFSENTYYAQNNIFFINVLEIQGGVDYSNFKIVTAELEFLYFDALHFTKLGSRIFGESLKKKYGYLFETELLKHKDNQNP